MVSGDARLIRSARNPLEFTKSTPSRVAMVEMYRRYYSNIRATVGANENKRMRRLLTSSASYADQQIGYHDDYEWNYIE
jgi:hypothetical protein